MANDLRNIRAGFRKLRPAVVSRLVDLSFFFRMRSAILRSLGNKIGRNVAIHSGITFFATGNLQIGDDCTINHGCYLDNRSLISIGRNVNISHDVKIYTWGHDIDDPMFLVQAEPVYIHDDVWIFPNVLVMPGVTLGEGAVVLPGAVVTKSVEPYTVVGGVPAKPVKRRASKAAYKIDYRVWFAI